MWERRLRRLHRLATIVIGLQLLVWTATGVAFSWFNFATVRGEGERRTPPTLQLSDAKLSIEQALARAGGRAVSGVELRSLGARVVYQLNIENADPLIIDARDGSVVEPVDAQLAGELGRAAHSGAPAVAEVALVSSRWEAPDLALPVWRVRLADARRTEVFVAPSTGKVLAFRNSTWRWFDRLWTLHVLGYVNRDSPSHVPMRIVAALALLAVLSGGALLVARRRANKSTG